jgi:2-polyprenyl-3-methyl-5-hydroxy-6-metoxy-1,4-benzoquinol methylase
VPTEAKVYRALIASPSDVEKEREAARNTVIEWNGSRAKEDIYLEPVMWETHVAPDLGKEPQKIINEQIVDACDLVIGMFWKRIGTETDNNRGGAVEEIDRIQSNDNPAIVGFSEKAIPPNEINSNQYEKLTEFRNECEENGLVFTYKTVEEFKHRLSQHLAQTMNQIIKKQQPQIEFSKQTEKEDSTYEPTEDYERLEVQADFVADHDKRNLTNINDYLDSNDVEPPYRVLDAGCGYGNLTKRLFGNEKKYEVTAIDKNEEAINVARNEYCADNIQYDVFDLNEVHLADFSTFDIVYSTFVFHHLKKQESILANLWNLIDSDTGAFLIRSVDDGLHAHYPPDKDLDYLVDMGGTIKGSVDRTHGRRMYTHLKRLNPQPERVDLDFKQYSTADLSRAERKEYFDVLHSWRVNPARRVAERPDASEGDKKLYQKMSDSLNRVEQQFIDNPNLMDVKFIPLAVAYR